MLKASVWPSYGAGNKRSIIEDNQQRQHSSKTFTIDSDDEDENDYQRSDDDSDDDGRGNNNNQKRKGQSLVVLFEINNVARAYQHEEEEEVLFFDTSQHEFSICRFLLVLIAITFALIFLIEQFAPKDVYIHRTIENGRNEAKVKVRDHARRAREAFRAYTSVRF